jgi:hypothetical protein
MELNAKFFLLLIIGIFCIYHYAGVYRLMILSLFAVLYLIAELRHKFAYFPLYIITIIQGRNFKLVKNYSEVKHALKFKDKGKVIEELFATPAWDPIISLESTNGKTWETLRSNFLKLMPHLPSYMKLAEIASKEADFLLKKNKPVDSKDISKSTFKIFITWLFCEDNSDENNNQFNNNFVTKYVTEELIENIYQGSVEYRKEIAIKGKGDDVIKRQSVTEIVKIFQESKYKNLFDWTLPENYSVIMQPFIISPMINISDIAVSLKNSIENQKSFPDDMSFIENCLFNNHPFPILERYDESTNTQYFIDLRNMNEIQGIEGNAINFGLGYRACLGRTYAKEFMKGFFPTLLKNKELFQPQISHLYSGRDNDNINFSESLYQIKVLVQVLVSEIKRRIFN